MDQTTNSLNWFEVPAVDIERARRFYETIFAIEMQALPLEGLKMVTFPWSMGNGRVTGALVQHQMYKPSTDGVLIYLNADPDLQAVLDRIEPAGGKILIPRTQISPEFGYMAVFLDTEGNRLALHARH